MDIAYNGFSGGAYGVESGEGDRWTRGGAPRADERVGQERTGGVRARTDRCLPGGEDLLDRRHLHRRAAASRPRTLRPAPGGGLGLHRTAGDAGRPGQNAGFQALPGPAQRNLQRGPPARSGPHLSGRDRHGRGEPLPLPEDRRARGRDPGGGAHEHRHRRPLHGARLSQELPARGLGDRSRGLRRAARRAVRQRRYAGLCHAPRPDEKSLRPHRAV